MRRRKLSAKPALSKSVAQKNTRPAPSILPAPVSRRRKGLESPETCLPEVETDFAELRNGSVVETVEDPADPNHTLLAIFKRGRIRLAGRVEDRGRILVPIPRSTLGFSGVKLPCGILPYKPVARLALTIAKFIRYVVDVPHEYALFLSAFVLYTWVADRLPTAVYLSVIGLPQSGKSTLLELLSMICRQPLLVNDISQAAAYQACSNFSPTLLLDEIDWHASRPMSSFRQLLRAGISRSARALRIRQSSSSFGPKVFGSLEASPDSALNSRCIELVMAETNKTGLFKPSHPSIVKIACELRQRLLWFRFGSYKSIRPAPFKGTEELRPRSRDLFCSLAAALVGSRVWTQFLLEFIKDRHDPVTREPLEPRHEALHAVLWDLIHQARILGAVRYGGEMGLMKATNDTLQQGGERLTVNEKAVGSMLSSMGFRSRQRTKFGWIVQLDSATVARCHQLMKTHGNRYVPDWDFAQHSATCATCKAFAASPGN